jgi:membrane protease YdiL (CAAX protease family)
MTWFVALGFIGLFPTSLVFGELRLKTGSLWPAYIAHNITNAISAQLIIEGFIKFKPGAELIFSSNLDGLLMMGLFWGIGLWMLKRRTAS